MVYKNLVTLVLYDEVSARKTCFLLDDRKKGSFSFCGQNQTCNFFCWENDGYLYEKAIAAWRSTNQPHPVCGGHNKRAKMRVVKDMMKESYGRPFLSVLKETVHVPSETCDKHILPDAHQHCPKVQ